jgi:hypothetical protein
MSHHLNLTEVSHIDERMHHCIAACSACHDICLATAVHCLRLGGEHAAPEHIRELVTCATICDTSRDFMLTGSDLHSKVCRVCAEACQRCAESCETRAADDEVMRRCAEICRRCADSCSQMAGAAG